MTLICRSISCVPSGAADMHPELRNQLAIQHASELRAEAQRAKSRGRIAAKDVFGAVDEAGARTPSKNRSLPLIRRQKVPALTKRSRYVSPSPQPRRWRRNGQRG
jgi:hypothetical protein